LNTTSQSFLILLFPSREVSQLWANKILSLIPDLDYIISSEPYGAYLAEYLQCESIFYDIARTITNISASLIRQHPLRYWDYIADSAKPYFVKKICIYGSESTGKSTLTVNLAQYFKTNYVPEMAREVIEKQRNVRYHILNKLLVYTPKLYLKKHLCPIRY
jgi:HTH-type transcriptional repressor of NAD biosynthesis genes